jgi:hypothetical protein
MVSSAQATQKKQQKRRNMPAESAQPTQLNNRHLINTILTLKNYNNAKQPADRNDAAGCLLKGYFYVRSD